MNPEVAYYAAQVKPFFFPSEHVFTVAWSAIYPLIAVATVYLAYLIYKGKISPKVIILFAANLIANSLYTPLQFTLKSNILAGFDLLVVFFTIAFFELFIWKENKLMFFNVLPYVIWMGFATFLQLTLTFLNIY